jgi:hypothetical protein
MASSDYYYYYYYYYLGADRPRRVGVTQEVDAALDGRVERGRGGNAVQGHRQPVHLVSPPPPHPLASSVCSWRQGTERCTWGNIPASRTQWLLGRGKGVYWVAVGADP